MPVVQQGQYFNIKLDPGEQLAVQKQYAGAGKVTSNGSFRYSFIVNGNSASVFVSPEVSAQLATIAVGTSLILKKDEGQYGKITAALADGSPLPPAAPGGVPVTATLQSPVPSAPPVSYNERPQINRDQSIAWQNANNAAAVMSAQAKDQKATFIAMQRYIYESYLEEFMPDESKQRKLVKEAESLFGKDDSPSEPVKAPQDTSVPFLDNLPTS